MTLTLDHLTGTKVCLIRYHAEQIAASASAAYWTECDGGRSLEHHRRNIAEQFAELAALIAAPEQEAAQ